MKILISTHNQGKIKEIEEIFSNTDFEVISLSDVGIDWEIEETGKTFVENAILKAKIYGEKTGLLTIADDSGLEVDALNGRPGIYSTRYATGTDADRNNKVLAELNGAPTEKRTARYHCVAALFNPQTKEVKTFDGVWEGRIAEAARGNKSFGYAPIFLAPEYGYNKTNAEIDPCETIKINHRGKAFMKLLIYINDQII